MGGMRDYGSQRRGFETTVACIDVGGCEYYFRKPVMHVREACLLDKAGLSCVYGQYRYQDAGGSQLFLERWLRDPDRRTATGVVCEPPDSAPEGAVNLWRPFACETRQPVADGERRLGPVLLYFERIFSGEGWAAVLRFLFATLCAPSQRLPYSLVVVGDEWYACSCLAHFVCRYVIGSYLADRVIEPAPETRKGMRLVWVDFHDTPREYFEIPMQEHTRGGSEPEWSVRNNTNVLVTTRTHPDACWEQHVVVVSCKPENPPAHIEALLRNHDIGRAFFDFVRALPPHELDAKQR